MNATSLLRVCLTVCLLTGLPAQAQTFQLKGVTIGSTSAIACGTSKITDAMGDIIRASQSEAPSLVDMRTTECEVDFGTFGGNKLSIPAKLLFLDGRLILLKIELTGLPLANFVDIYKALLADYGKAARAISRPFVADTWKARGQTLVLERLGREWDDNDVTIILKGDEGYGVYEARSSANSKILKALNAKRTRNDIR